MTESQLQQKIVLAFGQKHPEDYGHLFMANNTGFTDAQRGYNHAIGQISGVADLQYCRPGTNELFAVEVKAPGTKHDKKHIKKQLYWIMKVPKYGIMSERFDIIIAFLFAAHDGDYETCRKLSITEMARVKHKVEESRGQKVMF